MLCTPSVERFWIIPDSALCDFGRGFIIGFGSYPAVGPKPFGSDKPRVRKTTPKDIKPKERDRLDAIYKRYAGLVALRSESE